jgi:hypothetical protein
MEISYSSNQMEWSVKSKDLCNLPQVWNTWVNNCSQQDLFLGPDTADFQRRRPAGLMCHDIYDNPGFFLQMPG